MAKVKLGNVKGSKGDKGDRGSLWRVTDKMTGRSTSDTAFPGANIEDSAVGDMCLNPITCDIYKCTAGGDAANAKWVWVMNNRGPQGPAGPKGDPTTVDAVLSKDSVNPIQNKAVATKFQDVQDSLDRVSLHGIDAVAFNDNAGDVELWMYTDAAQRNGIVVGISPTAIQLYKIKNGDTTPTKRFE